MNGQEEAILRLWKEEGMSPAGIALKLGTALSNVLSVILPKAIGHARDEIDKIRLTATEEKAYEALTRLTDF